MYSDSGGNAAQLLQDEEMKHDQLQDTSKRTTGPKISCFALLCFALLCFALLCFAEDVSSSVLTGEGDS